MTIGNALTFIKRGQTDSELRQRLNSASDLHARDAVLSDEHLVFSPFEFDEAYHHQLTLCQTVEAADQLAEFKMWWDILSQMLNPDAGNTTICSGTACSGCCG